MVAPAVASLAHCLALAALCAVAAATDGASDAAQGAEAIVQAQAKPEDGYPFEPLLDEDYIHDSSNPLDRFVWDTAQEAINLPAQRPASLAQGCHTAPPRRASWFTGTAQVGTLCVFGVDARDENGHCINDDPSRYGPLGWCWTKEDQSEWGSCADDCPLYGGAKIVQQKIKGTEDKLRQAVETTALLKKMTAEREEKAAAEAEAPEAAPAAAAPAAAPAAPAPGLLLAGQAQVESPAEEALEVENARLRAEVVRLTKEAAAHNAAQPSRGLQDVPPLTLEEQSSETHASKPHHKNIISGLLRRFAAQRAAAQHQ